MHVLFLMGLQGTVGWRTVRPLLFECQFKDRTFNLESIAAVFTYD